MELNELKEYLNGYKECVEIILSMQRACYLDTTTLQLLKNAIQQSHKEMEQIISTIQKLNNSIGKTIIVMRHIECLSWPDIADQVNYSEAHCQRLYKKALRELAKVLREE